VSEVDPTQCYHPFPCTCGLTRIIEDRDAAMSLLRLWVVDHRYAKGCKSNGGIACYGCRTVEWLEAHSQYRHVNPAPDPEGTVRVSLRAAATLETPK
jgi:hypothetical protein